MPAAPPAAPSPAKPTPTRIAAAAVPRALPAPAAPLAAADPGYTRLHITPFDAELLTVVVPASARPDARNVSFHNLQTFPEKRYGFVDLPAEAAEKLRRKLNGAVLKGVKLRIEPARQTHEEKEKADEAARIKMGKKSKDSTNLTPEQLQRKEEERAARKEKKRLDKEKGKKGKLQAAHEELEGVQLEPGRQVKRGWTVPDAPEDNKKSGWSKDKKDKKDKDKSSKKKGERSEYTEGPECLFKTILPANKVPKSKLSLSGKIVSGSSNDNADVELDERALKRKRKEEKKAREVVVHEFANWTRIPTFLKSSSGSGASNAHLEYVEGKGWVDESTGEVVQPLKSTRPVAVTGLITKEAQLAKRAKLDEEAAARAKILADEKEEEEVSETSDSETSDSGSDSSTSSDDSSVVVGAGKGNDDDNLEYVPGKGWVNESTGEVVEPIKNSRPAVTGLITKEAQLAKRAKLDARAAERAKMLAQEEASDTSDSGSDTSSDEDVDDEKLNEDEPLPSAEADNDPTSPTRPRSSGSANLTIKIPPPPSFGQTPSTPAGKKEVHPLEALYKRAKPGDDDKADKKKAGAVAATPKAEADKPFSFFGGLNNDDIEEDGDAMDVVAAETADDDALQPPMTPFSRGEFEWRNVRSAAPTPDTAHPNRMSNFKWPTPGGADEEEDEEDEDDEMEEPDRANKAGQSTEAASAKPGEGDFQSWFWDNRGDLNRSWKRRRKTAAKDKRYRENRARAERAI
ncbi:hypothetical protein SBRCBS47491_005710 [Sporothrix bragantina]|uniref:Suppressor protein srp40 n=1 Tax=Sporothrix bragantina TaxID=671064 RepID=A0ABP0BZN0_9PEZI